MYSKFCGTSFWTAAQRIYLTYESPFYWKPDDNQMSAPVRFWGKDEPKYDNKEKNCGVLVDILLFSKDCSFTYCYICEKFSESYESLIYRKSGTK